MVSQPSPYMLENCYHLPWNWADNATSWIEPTTKCDLYCQGCYRDHKKVPHKPLDELIADLDLLQKLRNTDSVAIAGGEPLLYPRIVELVEQISKRNWKAVIISNGNALTPALVSDLKRAGLVGFVLHIDSHQCRPRWNGKTEEQLHELRLEKARMIHDAGGGQISCFFNIMIRHSTLKDIPHIVRWAQQHIDLVQSVSFCLFRCLHQEMFDKYDFQVNGQSIDLKNHNKLPYYVDSTNEPLIDAQQIIELIKEASPDYEPYAYLSKTGDTRKPSVLMALRMGSQGSILGYMDA